MTTSESASNVLMFRNTDLALKSLDDSLNVQYAGPKYILWAESTSHSILNLQDNNPNGNYTFDNFIWS